MTKEQRILEIMDELSCCSDTAETIFYDEICEKYETDDLDVAEVMFLDDEEEIKQCNAQLSMGVI